MTNLQAFGRGCAFLDYDGDGRQDILLVSSPHVILYRNTGDGRFEDVTQQTGLTAVTGDWRGVAVGDYNSDGFPDLLLSGYHRLALLKNQAGKRFADVTQTACLPPNNHNHFGSSAGFMDLRGNGMLDLVLLNYVVFGPRERQYCELVPDIKSGCPPNYYRPEFGELWENLGNGRFRDATASSGMKNTHGKALVVAFADVNGDGRMDFYIGNDGTPAELMINQGGLHFKNTGVEAGVAYARMGHAIAAMGADWADYDRDGRLDLVVTAFSDETYSLNHNLGGGLFEQVNDATGISEPTRKRLGFGAKWLDYDNDGWPDILFANGHVYDNAERIDPLTNYREPIMLFHNEQGRKFEDLVPRLGGDLATPLVGRGCAVGDFDNDGRIDFLVVDYEGAPVLMHNVSQTQNHWITLDLRSDGPNRFAYGAQVRAKAGKEIWAGQVSPASGYLSSSDPRVHFGLGKIALLESVTIRWSDGRMETLKNIAADKILRVTEGKGAAGETPRGR